MRIIQNKKKLSFDEFIRPGDTFISFHGDRVYMRLNYGFKVIIEEIDKINNNINEDLR